MMNYHKLSQVADSVVDDLHYFASQVYDKQNFCALDYHCPITEAIIACLKSHYDAMSEPECPEVPKSIKNCQTRYAIEASCPEGYHFNHFFGPIIIYTNDEGDRYYHSIL